ncbi:hypothetical protein [Staphylococcus felis]|uniref:hypothetical protein n=1 Tax=Staphylococcus felis TaxID=46127 RepID=UPI0021D230A9|nr:hypothetical protein [Staphylococcus felis]UXR86206.1 hypothetical protein MUA17_09120 [Staphylococcus felis]UXR87100.1 hypothetical protein MUA17_01910 [Staphylococcus felis]
MEFIGFADVQEFIKISGISEWDFEHKVCANTQFKEECMFRFGKGGKRYIEIKPALEFIKKNILIRESDL